MTSRARDLMIVAVLVGATATCCAVIIAWPATTAGAGTGVSTPPVPDLRAAPWAHQPDGSPIIDDTTILPSAVFPAGIDYPEALRALYLAARGDGRLPSEVQLMAPLPAEVVLVHAAAGQERLQVSLTAPFGWTIDTRRIRPPSLHLPAGTNPDQVSQLLMRLADPAAPLPAGVGVDVPSLTPCQVAVGTPQNRPSCD